MWELKLRPPKKQENIAGMNASATRNRNLHAQVSLILLHKRNFRLALTPTSLGNRVNAQSRRMRRDSYPVNRKKFLYRPILKLRAKRGVPPRQLSSIRQECSPLSDQEDGKHVATAVPARTAQVQLATSEKEFQELKEENRNV